MMYYSLAIAKQIIVTNITTWFLTNLQFNKISVNSLKISNKFTLIPRCSKNSRGQNYRIQGHSFLYHWITTAAIVICLVQRKILTNLQVLALYGHEIAIILPEVKWLHNEQTQSEIKRAFAGWKIYYMVKGNTRRSKKNSLTEAKLNSFCTAEHVLSLTNIGGWKVTTILSKFFGSIVSIALWEISYNNSSSISY